MGLASLEEGGGSGGSALLIRLPLYSNPSPDEATRFQMTNGSFHSPPSQALEKSQTFSLLQTFHAAPQALQSSSHKAAEEKSFNGQRCTPSAKCKDRELRGLEPFRHLLDWRRHDSPRILPSRQIVSYNRVLGSAPSVLNKENIVDPSENEFSADYAALSLESTSTNQSLSRSQLYAAERPRVPRELAGSARSGLVLGLAASHRECTERVPRKRERGRWMDGIATVYLLSVGGFISSSPSLHLQRKISPLRMYQRPLRCLCRWKILTAFLSW